jgi:hypothetical protein
MPSYQPCAVLQGMAIAPAPAQAVHQRGQRIRARPQPRGVAVRHARVGPQHGGDVVLVAFRRGEQRETGHEMRAGERTHAAEHAENAVAHAHQIAPT